MLDAYTLLEMGLNFFILTSAGLLIRVIYFACWPLRTIYLVRVSHQTVFYLSTQLALRVRQEMQEKLVAAVASAESEQLKRFEELMELKQRQEYQSMRDMMERE